MGFEVRVRVSPPHRLATRVLDRGRAGAPRTEEALCRVRVEVRVRVRVRFRVRVRIWVRARARLRARAKARVRARVRVRARSNQARVGLDRRQAIDPLLEVLVAGGARARRVPTWGGVAAWVYGAAAWVCTLTITLALPPTLATGKGWQGSPRSRGPMATRVARRPGSPGLG